MTTWKNEKRLGFLIFCLVFSITICGAASAASTNSTHDNLQSASANQANLNSTPNEATTPTTNSINTSKSPNSTVTTTQNTNNTKASKSTGNTKLPDPQVYRSGVSVGTYSTIAEAIAAAISGDTIMLENGATFDEHGLVIDKNLNFNVFNDGTATIDGQNLGTIFIIDNGVTVNLQNLIIENGLGTDGGGIYNNGTLTVTNCTFTGNNAQNGGAIYNDATINVANTTTVVGNTIPINGGTLTVINSTFTGNTATGNGGAIYNGGLINISNSTLTSNTATYNGGTATITGSTFKGNTAQNGGALYNDATITISGLSTLTGSTATHNGGTLTVNNSTLIDNIATGNGGAIYNGGVINITNSTLTGSTAQNGGILKVTNSTIIGNQALNGGAIYNAATVTLANSTLTDNIGQNGGTFTITNNTIAGNAAKQNGGALDNEANINATNNTFTTNTIANGGGTLTIINNSITGNTAPNGAAIYNNASIINLNNSGANTVANGGTVTATPNWWGSNAGPAGGDVSGNETTTVTGWLLLNMNITVTASNLAPNVGQPYYYTITVTNSGPDDAPDVQVSDGIPAGLTFNSSTASQGTYNHATEIWNVGPLASGASAVLQLFVTPTASVAGTNVTKNATLIDTGQMTNVTVAVPSQVANVTLTKTASNSLPNVGQQFSYTLTANNSGAADATGVQVIDVIPAGLTFNSYTASQGTYNSTTGLWNVGTIASGANAVLTLYVTPTASVAGTTLINNATLVSTGQVATATVAVPKTPVSNVTLTKTASNSSPNVGQQYSYTVTANNSGAAAANNVTVTDNIPAGLTFNSYTASQGTYNSATGIWNVGTITSGANAVLTLYVTPTASVAGTTVINSATIPGQIATATVAVPKTPVSNVTLTKTASNSTPNVGQQFHYTLTATNHGPGTATGVQVTDVIPTDLTFNSYTASQGTYNSATGIWNVGTIASGASATLNLYVTPTASVAGKNVTNFATVSGHTVSATIHVGSVSIKVPTHQVTAQSTSLQSTSSPKNVSTSTVPMLPTGAPLMPLFLGALMMVAGFANNARKKLK
ncbi:MAG: beta strand repeat-containing protein [Methanobacterium sp.]